MDRKMRHTARAELLDAVRRRYRSAVEKGKRKILDEFVAITVVWKADQETRARLHEEAFRACGGAVR